MDLISVIVPVYKVEAWLDRCVQSIVDQTYRNLEIILVDDGSPDNCGTMCDTWAEKDSRIRVIHKENGGGAQARNVGLEHASGDYIAFVDSDDYILPDMYETLLSLLPQSGSDIAECGYYSVTSEEPAKQTPEVATVAYYTTEQALRENIRDRICRQLVWNKLYSRPVLEGVRFVEGKFIDDEFFTYRALGNAKKVAVTSQRFYCYRQQSGSAMHQSYSLKWLDAVEAKQCRLAYLKDAYPTLVPDAQINLLFTCLYHGQLSLRHLSNDHKSAAIRSLKVAVNHCSLPSASVLSGLSVTHRCWLWLAYHHFTLCCRLRNLLKIGL